MMQLNEKLIDTLALGFVLWFAGYAASLALYFSLPQGMLGWVLFLVLTPATAIVTYWRFRGRELPLQHYILVATTWTAMAVVLDYFFIVVLFRSVNYYQLDVLVYYATAFLIPMIMGMKYSKG